MKKYQLQKLKEICQYCIMRWFSSPETFIKWYLSRNHGSIKLNDGTWAVNQSDEFHTYCYKEAYNEWKKNNI